MGAVGDAAVLPGGRAAGSASPMHPREQEEEAEGTFLLSPGELSPSTAAAPKGFLFLTGSALTKCGQSIPLQKFSRLQVSDLWWGGI